MPVGVKGDLKTFSVAVNAAFKTALQGKTAPKSGVFSTVVQMSTREVEFPIAGTVGPMREWKGSRIVKSVIRNSYRIKTKKYEKTIGIPVEDMEDDNLDIYMPAINMLGYQCSAWRDQLVFKALELNGLAYDGVAFFATTHQEQAANVANYVAGGNASWYLFDTTKPLQAILWGERIAPKITPKTSPTDDNVFDKDELLWGARARGGAGYGLWQAAFKSKTALDATNFEAAITAMRLRKDDEGESLDITPDLLVVSPASEFDAKRLLGRSVLATGEENIHAGTSDGIKWIVANRLTGA